MATETRTEVVLRRIAIGCAIFMLFGPLSDRTSETSGKTTMTDAAGYNLAALASGIVALGALALALWARPRVILPLMGALVAMLAFGLTVFASGIYVQARMRGEVFFYGTGSPLNVDAYSRVHPAVGPPFFLLAAVIGAVSALMLAIYLLRSPDA